MKNELDFFRGQLWNPLRDFREFSDLQRGMNRLFEDFHWNSSLKKGATDIPFAPSCDIEETETQYLMTFDIPGVKKEDIKLELVDRDLVVFGERKEEKREEKKSRHLVERYYGSFQRVITLPASVNTDQLQASYENGVLKVLIPKTESVRKKQIRITEGNSNK